MKSTYQQANTSGPEQHGLAAPSCGLVKAQSIVSCQPSALVEQSRVWAQTRPRGRNYRRGFLRCGSTRPSPLPPGRNSPGRLISAAVRWQVVPNHPLLSIRTHSRDTMAPKNSFPGLEGCDHDL